MSFETIVSADEQVLRLSARVLPRQPIEPELKLLAACAIRPDEQARGLWHACLRDNIRYDVDWSKFLSLVSRHRLQALADDALAGDLRTHVPKELSDRLRRWGLRARLKTMQQIVTARQVCDAFRAAGIVAVQQKGGPLSQRLYGDPTLRCSKDIDILVAPDDYTRAARVLLDLGFGCDEAGRSPWCRSYQLLVEFHRSFVRSGVEVELHWSLGHGGAALPDLGLALIEPVTGAPVLPWEQQVPYLLFHGSRHFWARLKWLSDIAQSALVQRSEDRGTAAALFTSDNREDQIAGILLSWLYERPFGIGYYGQASRPLSPNSIAAARYALWWLRSSEGGWQRCSRAILRRAHYRLATTPPRSWLPAALRLGVYVYRTTARRTVANL